MLVAIIVIIVLFYVINLILSISGLLSTEKPDVYVLVVTLAYPILDAILLVPAILIFWIVRKISSSLKKQEEQKIEEDQEDEELHITTSSSSSVWILLLSISMMLFAISNSGFAFVYAYDPEIVQNNVWMWDMLYNAGYLCLAAAMIGYRHFFFFRRVDTLQH